MVELLAVMTILGILLLVTVPSVSNLIKKSKSEHLEAQKSTFIMAAKSYMENNKNELPKSIGDNRIITADMLKESNYLKEDLFNAKKESCMKNSIVRVYKYDKNKYNYLVHFYCGDEKLPDELPITKPKIDVVFTDTSGNDILIAKKNVNSAVVNIKFNGNKNNSNEKLGIDGYSYSILVQYDNSQELVEIYNSGSLNAYGKQDFEINKNITEYIDVKRLTNIRVMADAYNREGGYLKVLENAEYQDNEPPICENVIGEAKGENDWDKNLKKRKITVNCNDGDGSGCVKDKFTKTFTEEMEWGYITIKDNAGKETKCKVRVNLDWSSPTIKVNAYKRLSDGSRGEVVGTVIANEKNNKVTLKEYKYGIKDGDDNWLNAINYPYGVIYEVLVDDNIKLESGYIGKGTLLENVVGLKKSDALNNQNLGNEIFKEYSISDKTTSFTFVPEGYRIGEYKLVDKAKNTSTVKIIAPIDRTPPTCSNVLKVQDANGRNYTGGWLNNNIYTTANCSDNMSGCGIKKITTRGKTQNYTLDERASYTVKANGTSSTNWYVYDKALNETNCGVSTQAIDKKKPTCSIRKENKNNPNGVKVVVSCNDYSDSSGCRVVKQEFNKVKLSRSYTVYDNSNPPNSGSCNVTVTGVNMYNKQTCNSCKRCSQAGCASMKTVSNSYSTFVGTAPGHIGCAEMYNGGNRSKCHKDLIHDAYSINCVCTITTTSSYCALYNQSCSECGGCDSWGDWTGYVNERCSSSTSVKCSKSVKYYK